MLSELEKERYSRHIKLSEFGLEKQVKLKQAKVLVIGAGGLGCPVVQYLAAAGVGTIGVIDADEVSFSNLQRQILFSPKQVGELKVDAIKNWVNSFNPEITCNAINAFISVANAKTIVADYDVIIDGSDNFSTRYLVNDVCQLLNKPLVFGSIFKFEGQLTVFHYQGGPSYRCLYPQPPAFGSVPACGDIGVLGVLPGIIGAYMGLETIKIITDVGEVLSGKLLTVNTLNNQTQIIRFEKSTSPVTELLSNYDQFCGMPEIKESISVTELSKLMERNKVQLIDVREAHELAICSIGGKHIPMNNIPGGWEGLDANKPVYVLCHHGMRSAMVQKWLNENTLLQAINIEGGIHAWSLEVDDNVPTY
jgi:molybdopterin/thiamine biosynthesis adenylyltransferase/rhodanese-related sulfurtransferase